MSAASADTTLEFEDVVSSTTMAGLQQQQQPTRAEQLSEQWRDFRAAGSLMYDTLLWQDQKWPALSLAWLPSRTAWTQPPALAAAEATARQARQRRFDRLAAAAAALDPVQQQHTGDAGLDDDSAAGLMDVDQSSAAAGSAAEGTGQAAGGTTHQLVQMPVDFQYLLVGTQTSGQGAATVDVYRVELPGSLQQQVPPEQQQKQQQKQQQVPPEQQQKQQQRVLMQKSDMQQVMRISHGLLDVNQLAVMPQQPNIFATACDEPELYLFDLRQHEVQEWASQADADVQGRESEQLDGDAGGSSSSQDTGNEQQADSEGHSEPLETSSESVGAGPTEPAHPQAVLVSGRRAGGYGLEWNPQKQNILLGGDSAGGVQMWDVAAACSSSSGGSGGGSSGGSNGASSTVAPRVPAVQEVHAFVPCAINDLSWHRGGNAYALALEDGQVLVQDLRVPPNNGNSSSGAVACSSRSGLGLTAFKGPGVCLPRTGRVHVRRRRERRLRQLEAEGAVQPLGADCFCVAFDPLHDYRLASGGADGRVKLLDMRRLDGPVEELGLHAGSVSSVAWSHSLPGLLASAGEEGAVLLWDANKLQHAGSFRAHRQQQQEGLGLPQPPHIRRNNLSTNVRQYSLPGLLFVHGGHFGAVGGLALCHDRPWLVASSTGQLVEAGGVVIQRQPVQVWEVNRSRGLLC